jgi:hypothetical protein
MLASPYWNGIWASISWKQGWGKGGVLKTMKVIGSFSLDKIITKISIMCIDDYYSWATMTCLDA